MASRLILILLLAFGFLHLTSSQVSPTTSAAPSSAAAPAPTSAAPTSSRASTSRASNSSTTRTTSSSDSSGSTPPDVLLNVPNLSVGRIELDVDNLKADINLNAAVAGLVTINAGVALSIQQVNLTITDVQAQLELIVRLGHLVDIVNRVFESLDLNPLLINLLNNVTSIVDDVIGAVDGLLGSITQGGTTLSFLVDNLGNIVQEVGGVSTIVGSYLNNMTFTGEQKTLSNGNIQKTYSYSPLGALVNIIFNTAGQILQATVAKKTGTSSTSSAPVSTSTSS